MTGGYVPAPRRAEAFDVMRPAISVHCGKVRTPGYSRHIVHARHHGELTIARTSVSTASRASVPCATASSLAPAI